MTAPTEEPKPDIREAQRVKNEYTLHETEDPGKCPAQNHQWRTVRCDNDTDTVECQRCGRQAETRCNFDEDFS